MRMRSRTPILRMKLEPREIAGANTRYTDNTNLPPVFVRPRLILAAPPPFFKCDDIRAVHQNQGACFTDEARRDEIGMKFVWRSNGPKVPSTTPERVLD